ncbi:SPOR domain-containing protein [Roseivivax sp. CAU 1753]
MADIYRSGSDSGVAGQGTIATLTHLTGAAMSLALIVGIGVWGTKLIMRDVSGIPVVQATEGPMRVQPVNPGGRPADHQGLAVNDVAGQGMASPPPAEIRLAPQSVSLTDDDVPLGRLASRPAPRQPRPTVDPTPKGTPAPTLAETIPPDPAVPAPVSPDAVADMEAPPAEDVEMAAPPSMLDDDPVRAAIDATIEMALEADGGIARSLRPKTRPQGLRRASVGATPPTTAPGIKEIAPASIPAGTRLVQLGAYDSPETARAEWTRFETRFEDYLTGKDRVIEQAASGGKTFYRLRAHGFADLSDARRFCAALVAGNADCIPVVTR